MSDSLHPDVPAIDQNVFSAMQSLKELPKIQKALDIAQKQTDQAMAEQVEICEIPSPTFHEEKRAEEIARRMKAYGLTDVTIDAIGNVVGVRKGNGHGPVLVIDVTWIQSFRKALMSRFAAKVIRTTLRVSETTPAVFVPCCS